MIETGPDALFIYLEVPKTVQAFLRPIAKKAVAQAGGKTDDVDHVTMVHVKDPVGVTPEKIEALVNDFQHSNSAYNLKGTLTGFAYFDGVESEDKPATALVALLDIPDLQFLQTCLYTVTCGQGFEPSEDHGFTAHVTLAYLPNGARVDLPVMKKLPWVVDAFCIASTQIRRVRVPKFKEELRKPSREDVIRLLDKYETREKERDAMTKTAHRLLPSMPFFVDELVKIAQAEKRSYELTQDKRDSFSKKTFAIPGARKYPIQDEQHARSALGFAAMHGSSVEKEQVHAAVARRYPGLEKNAMATSMEHWWARLLERRPNLRDQFPEYAHYTAPHEG